MERIRIYLDNCCYNRPYDDQTQLRIELETKAKCDYLITTDDKLLKHKDERIRIISPIDFIVLEGSDK